LEISPALAEDLALLSDALDEPGAAIAATLGQLAVDVRMAVGSYLGLRVLADVPGTTVAFAALLTPAEVRSSILIPLARFGWGETKPTFSVILFAGRVGAFVDLAADLAWLTGGRVSDFALDQHLPSSGDVDRHGQIAEASVINQALGVLLSRGLTPEQALRELDHRASVGGVDRHSAAEQVLGEV